jgi:hypothetical protein
VLCADLENSTQVPLAAKGALRLWYTVLDLLLLHLLHLAARYG